MTIFFIRAVNSSFESRDAGSDYDRPEAALVAGVQSAVAIAADEIESGMSSSAVEVSVELADGTTMLRSVVALSVSPLKTTGSIGAMPAD